MKNRILFFIVFINLSFMVFAESTDDKIVTNLSKNDVKIGEKILLTIKIPDLKNVKILWEDMTSSDNSVDVISTKDYYKGNSLNFEIEFTFFNAGFYDDFHFTIPVSQEEEALYLVTDKFDITARGELTAEEIRNLKDIDDPSKIVLRKEKDIASIKFSFAPYLKIIIVIVSILLAGAVVYFILYKFIFKNKKGGSRQTQKLPPYENFLKNVALINFIPQDERVVTENKLSSLTEALKELIYDEYDLNAPSETTKELVRSLRDINFKDDITNEINTLYTEIDLIKFAKAPYDYDRLIMFLNRIKEIGGIINQDFRARNNEVKDADI